MSTNDHLHRLRIQLHAARIHDMDHLNAVWGAHDPHPGRAHLPGCLLVLLAEHALDPDAPREAAAELYFESDPRPFFTTRAWGQATGPRLGDQTFASQRRFDA